MKLERVLYVVIAAVALVWTQWLVIDLLHSGATLAGAWHALTANATTQLVSVDLSATLLAAVTFTIIEGRRLRLKLWWIYPLVCVTVALGVGLPLFLLARSTRPRV